MESKMTKFKCELRALIFFMLCLSGSACGQDEPPQPPNRIFSSKFLRTDEVQQELELTEDQLENIHKIEIDLFSGINKLRTQLLEGNAPDGSNENLQDVDKSNVAEVVESRVADAERAIMEGVLLDFQVKRLRQIKWQIEKERIGIDRFLKDESVSTFLGMTEKEKKEFFEKAMKERTRVAKKMEELRIEMEKKVLTFMPESCQERFDELLGDEFKIKRSALHRQRKR
jgi:hypothetical protein